MWFGLCLLFALPALGQRGGGLGGGIGFGSGAVGGAGFGRGAGGGIGFGRGGAATVLGFGTPGTFGSFGAPGAFGFGFGTPGFGGFRAPGAFGFDFGNGVFARFRIANPTVLGFGTPQNFLNLGIPPIGSPLPSLGVNAPGSAFFRGTLAEDTFPGWSLPFWPYYGGYGGYGGYDMAQAAQPSIIVIQPFSPEMMGQPRKPPEPARLEIREYKGPAAGEAQPAAAAPLGTQQMFSIVLKNGARDAAMAAWVDDDCLNYMNASGQRQKVALSAIDRAATERLNRQKNLSLWLPPE